MEVNDRKKSEKDSSAKNKSSYDYSKKTETTAPAKNNRVASYD